MYALSRLSLPLYSTRRSASIKNSTNILQSTTHAKHKETMFLRFDVIWFIFMLIIFTTNCHALSNSNIKSSCGSCSSRNTSGVFSTRRETLQTILLGGTIATLKPSISNAVTTDDEGLSVVTDSTFGRLVRRSTIQGARLFDRVDEQWERFSDRLRDENKCDEKTGRRLFDNGFRRDGTRVGNPVLGSLCKPEPLLALDGARAKEVVLDSAVSCALLAGVCGGNREVFGRNIDSTKDLVRQSFERASYNARDENEQKRIRFNFELYSTMRTINNAIRDGKSLRIFRVLWGRELLKNLATITDSNIDKYISTFGMDEKDNDSEYYSYDQSSLIRALGGLKVSLDALKKLGLCGVSEISIPSDDYGSVVTIAIDDYVPLGTEMLLLEQKYNIGGPAQALVRASMESTGIGFDLDSYYIDPSTTKQNLYNPTQILISLSNLREL